jgi:hypothetical protein
LRKTIFLEPREFFRNRFLDRLAAIWKDLLFNQSIETVESGFI